MNEKRTFEGVMESFAKGWGNFLRGIAPLAAGGPPATIFGVSLYLSLIDIGWPWPVSAFGGFLMAVCAEVVAYWSSKNSTSHNEETANWGKNILIAYTFLGLLYMAGYEWIYMGHTTIGAVGVMAYLFAPMAYYMVSLSARTTEEKENQQVEQTKKEEDLAYLRQQQEKKDEWDHEERMARLALEEKKIESDANALVLIKEKQAEQRRLKDVDLATLATAQQSVAELQDNVATVGNTTQHNATLQHKSNGHATDTATQQRNVATLTPTQQRMAQHWKPGMGATELADLADVHKSTASRYINNGAIKTYEAMKSQ